MHQRLVQPVVGPLRQRARLQADTHDCQVEVAQERDQYFLLARNLGFPDHLPGRVQHTHCSVVATRDPDMMVHGRFLISTLANREG